MPKDSLTAVIVSPDRATQRELRTALKQGFLAEAVWVVSDYPEVPALERLNEAQSGCVLFLDFSDPIRARRIDAELDLPGAMERHELEALGRAKEIFLIFTTDVTGMHMAKKKAEALQKLQLGEKVSAVINHAERRTTLPLADIEKVLQLPVRVTLPSDGKVVACAVQRGSVIEGSSPLAVQIEALAKSMVGTAVGNPSTGPVRRFIEFFSVSPERDPATWER